MLHEMRLLDLDTLKQRYQTEAAKLQTALFNGAQWEEIQECRHQLMEIEIGIFQKMRFTAPTYSQKFGRTA